MENMGNSSDVIWYAPGSTISRLHILSSFEQMLEVRDLDRSICSDSSAGISTLLIDGSSIVEVIVVVGAAVFVLIKLE